MDTPESISLQHMRHIKEALEMAKWAPSRDWEKKMAAREEREMGPRQQKRINRKDPDPQIERAMQSWAEKVRKAQQEAEDAAKSTFEYPAFVDVSSPGTSGATFTRSVSGDGWTVLTMFDPATNEYSFMAINSRTGEQQKLVREGEQRKVAAAPATPPNTIRTDWLKEANERANNSDMIIRIQLEHSGIVLIAMQGEDYATRIVSWETMEQAVINPLLPEIDQLEKQTNIVGKLKAHSGDKSKAA